MADKAGEYMEGHKVKFVRHTVPIKVELVEEGTPRRLKVEFKNVDTGAVRTEEYNTVRPLSVCLAGWLSVCLSKITFLILIEFRSCLLLVVFPMWRT